MTRANAPSDIGGAEGSCLRTSVTIVMAGNN